MKRHFAALASVSTLALAGLLSPAPTEACGACFHLESQVESTVVTGHRMAFALSKTHSVLWDQIEYSGSPESFAWVLPVKKGARVEVSNDAWFEALEAGTSARVVSPPLECTGPTPSNCGFGCGATYAASGGVGRDTPTVTVLHQGTVGPYETVTLHADVPGALPTWLKDHGFAVDAATTPIIDAYTSEGFDFIALRLLPDKSVQQMKPVRVITPGMSPTLPLRMVAAGTGATVDITLFVISEGRYLAQNFPNGEINPDKLIWDFRATSSNYATVRKSLLAEADGRTWNNAYARQGALLSQLNNPIDQQPITNLVGNQGFPTIAETYVRQGLANMETDTADCVPSFVTFEQSKAEVASLCAPSGGAGGGGTGGAGGSGGGSGGAGGGCVGPAEGQIDGNQFVCGKLDDLAVALEGLHPADVFLTRLEASLPRAALATDLILQAAEVPTEVTNWFDVKHAVNEPCDNIAASVLVAGPRSGGGGTQQRNRNAMYLAIMAALGAALVRRVRRPELRLARPGR
jgi:hypothetical protein